MGVADSRESDVGPIGAFFEIDSERSESRIGGGRQGKEFLPSIHLRDESAGAQPIDLVDMNGDKLGCPDCCESLFEFGKAIFGEFADEFGSDVELGFGDPG